MIYLDHNATSPLLPEVLDAMRPWLGVPANPSSAHAAGRAALAAVERAREQVAALVGGAPVGVVFTSGATEANHLGLRGLAVAHPDAPIAVGPTEHPCVFAAIEATGRPWRVLGCDAEGRVDAGSVPAGICALQAANHETGVLQPVDALCARSEVILHVDATQAAGRVPLDLAAAASVSLSSHKLGGPGGVGALMLPHGRAFPALFAGSQERGRRAGTVNTAGVVGFGAAAALAVAERRARQQLWRSQLAAIEAAVARAGGRVVGRGAPRVGNTVCAAFDGIRGELVVAALDLRGICVSAGAACQSGSTQPSPTLVAVGDASPRGAVRFSLGPRTVNGEVEACCEALPEVVRAVRDAAAWEADG